MNRFSELYVWEQDTIRDVMQRIDRGSQGLALVVDQEQRFVATRPVRAGDLLTTTVSIDTIRSAGGHDMITTRAEVSTSGGEHVVTALSTLVVRGPDGDG